MRTIACCLFVLLSHFGELGTACLDTDTGKVLWKAVLPSAHGVGAGSSPVVFRDLFIVPCDGTDQQYLVGLNKLTGEPVWKTPRPKMSGQVGDFHKACEGIWTKRLGGNYSASPLAAAGRIYFSNREGDTTVIRAGKEYEELAINKLNGEHMASPAVVDDSLLLRTNTHLYRIGSR